MAGRSSAPDPNQRLYDQYGGKAKYLAAKKARDDAKAAAAKSEQVYKDSNTALDQYLNQPNYGLYRKLYDAKQQNNTGAIATINAEIAKTKAKMKDNYNKIYLYETKIKDAQDAFEKKNLFKSGSTGGGNSGTGDSGSKSPKLNGKWKFNAPLVNNPSVLDKAQLPKMIGAGGEVTGDALNFWTSKENMGGKGTIQMDRYTNTMEFLANAKKSSADPKNFDSNFYGFKFHYNPTTVNMSWVGVTGANPVFEAASLDPAVPMASNLFGANISFDIILNRIQDIAMLEADGTPKYGNDMYGKGVSVNPVDLKTIAQKGTMYDLEYLFHAMHGFMLPTNFKSTLMGTKTSDPGWLPVRPVELHLGNQLRYRVRVSNLEVVHKIFSEKMIPILSVVTFSCARYWDGNIAKDAKK